MTKITINAGTDKEKEFVLIPNKEGNVQLKFIQKKGSVDIGHIGDYPVNAAVKLIGQGIALPYEAPVENKPKAK